MNIYNLQEELQKLMDKHKVHALTTSAVLEDMLPLLTEFVNQRVAAKLNISIRIEKRELEDILEVLKNLRQNSGIKLDNTQLQEINLLQYKIEELLHINKN